MELLTLIIAAVLSAFAYILGYRQREHEGRAANSLPVYKKVNRDTFQNSSLNVCKCKSKIEEDQERELSLEEQAKRSIRNTASSPDDQREELIKDQQKEIDRLMKELTDFKKREQKSATEISYLKAKVTAPTISTNSRTSQQQSQAELMTDQGFAELLDQASTQNPHHEDIDEEELSKQIDDSLI